MSLLPLLHVDAHLIVTDKPEGLLSVPGRGEAGKHNLTALVQAEFDDALVVHRLDMHTSGLMLFARGIEVQRKLSLAFEKRKVAKRYVAVAEGLIAQDEGEIDAKLRLDWPNRPRQIVDPIEGKPSLTRWRVMERGADCTRLALEPITGRSHQLRVHLQSIGHPIRGDDLYAPEPLRSNRLMLHAARLAFEHPGSGDAVVFESPVPF